MPRTRLRAFGERDGRLCRLSTDDARQLRPQLFLTEFRASAEKTGEKKRRIAAAFFVLFESRFARARLTSDRVRHRHRRHRRSRRGHHRRRRRHPGPSAWLR